MVLFFFSSRRRHTRYWRDWSSDVCSSDLVRKIIRDRKLRVFFCDMVKIAREVASEADLEMRMQGIVLLGAFLKLTPFAVESGMTDDEVYAGVEKALRKYFGKRGEQVVQDNLMCVKRGYSAMREIPA